MPKIVVIEDELHIRRLTETNLTASGYEVLVASNGEEGLSLAKLECPDLILLDLRLPGMSGWDVLAALSASEKLRAVPVVIMTATVTQGEEDEVRSTAIAGYLSKPFSIDGLLCQVKQALGEWG